MQVARRHDFPYRESLLAKDFYSPKHHLLSYARTLFVRDAFSLRCQRHWSKYIFSLFSFNENTHWKSMWKSKGKNSNERQEKRARWRRRVEYCAVNNVEVDKRQFSCSPCRTLTFSQVPCRRDCGYMYIYAQLRRYVLSCYMFIVRIHARLTKHSHFRCVVEWASHEVYTHGKK